MQSKLKFAQANPFQTRYDGHDVNNQIDALIPEVWAHESIAFLEENMVIGQLVHRDYSDEIAMMGDTVNIDKPSDFKALRKSVKDDVTIQDAKTANVPVRLNQHIHTSFLICDGEESKALQSLVDKYLEPALIAQARLLDQILLGQCIHFISNSYGSLGGLTGDNAKQGILGVRKTMNANKAHMNNRNLIWSCEGETAALNTDLFISAERVGDDGTALREASLGRKLGFNHFMSQNSSEYVDSPELEPIAINRVGGYSRGTTTIVVDGNGADDLTANMWIKILGQVYRIIAINGAELTLDAGLRDHVPDDAMVSGYVAGETAQAYPDQFDKFLEFSDGLQVSEGQFVTFGTLSNSPAYSIVCVEGNTMMLDRPLEVPVANNSQINVAPGGNYNFALHRNALALVTRPLAAPISGTGAMSAIVSHNGYAMRATITYNGLKQGHLVTLDMLAGVQVLDTDLGAVLLG